MNLKALRPIVRFILRHIYGVRGGLKTTTPKGLRNTRLQRIASRFRVMNRLYNWSELPLDWLLSQAAQRRPSAYDVARKELWAFFDYNHDLVLLESELDDIIDAVERYRAAVAGDKP